MKVTTRLKDFKVAEKYHICMHRLSNKKWKKRSSICNITRTRPPMVKQKGGQGKGVLNFLHRYRSQKKIGMMKIILKSGRFFFKDYFLKHL